VRADSLLSHSGGQKERAATASAASSSAVVGGRSDSAADRAHGPRSKRASESSSLALSGGGESRTSAAVEGGSASPLRNPNRKRKALHAQRHANARKQRAADRPLFSSLSVLATIFFFAHSLPIMVCAVTNFGMLPTDFGLIGTERVLFVRMNAIDKVTSDSYYSIPDDLTRAPALVPCVSDVWSERCTISRVVTIFCTFYHLLDRSRVLFRQRAAVVLAAFESIARASPERWIPPPIQQIITDYGGGHRTMRRPFAPRRTPVPCRVLFL
jgi:hypothetical protein